jgi:hypothetical protein
MLYSTLPCISFFQRGPPGWAFRMTSWAIGRGLANGFTQGSVANGEIDGAVRHCRDQAISSGGPHQPRNGSPRLIQLLTRMPVPLNIICQNGIFRREDIQAPLW